MSNDSNSIGRTILTGSAWSFIGVLLAAAFFYWQEYRNPFEFRIELIDEFNLVEVKEKINDLKILYKNEDILESQKEIKVIRLNLNNSGKTILQSYYDQLEPFGLRFSNSKILDAEVTSTNSKNLKEKLIEGFSLQTETEYDDLLFSKVIFDQGNYATLKVTLLQPANQELIVIPLGKIANIKALEVIRVKEEGDESVSPGWYIIGGYLGFVFLFVGIIFIIDFFETRTKKKKINNYREKHGEFSEQEDEIVKLYMEFNYRMENLMSGILANDYVLDFKDIIKKQQPSSISKLMFSSSHSRRIQFQRLPKAVFNVEGATISLNAKNSDFVKSFFSEVL